MHPARAMPWHATISHGQRAVTARVLRRATASACMQTSLSALLRWRKAERGPRTSQAQSAEQAATGSPRKGSVARTMKTVSAQPLLQSEASGTGNWGRDHDVCPPLHEHVVIGEAHVLNP